MDTRTSLRESMAKSGTLKVSHESRRNVAYLLMSEGVTRIPTLKTAALSTMKVLMLCVRQMADIPL